MTRKFAQTRPVDGIIDHILDSLRKVIGADHGIMLNNDSRAVEVTQAYEQGKVAFEAGMTADDARTSLSSAAYNEFFLLSSRAELLFNVTGEIELDW